MTTTYEVICEDGEKRHDGTFASRAEAEQFANWGHVCTVRHTYRTTGMWLTDNRYAVGSSGATLPAEAECVAMYSARWIDGRRIDIVPDRQGFAYDRAECRDLLIAALLRDAPHELVAQCSIDRDVTSLLICAEDVEVYVRRAGGYVYVDAWLWSEEHIDEQARIDGAPGR